MPRVCSRCACRHNCVMPASSAHDAEGVLDQLRPSELLQDVQKYRTCTYTRNMRGRKNSLEERLLPPLQAFLPPVDLLLWSRITPAEAGAFKLYCREPAGLLPHSRRCPAPSVDSLPPQTRVSPGARGRRLTEQGGSFPVQRHHGCIITAAVPEGCRVSSKRRENDKNFRNLQHAENRPSLKRLSGGTRRASIR